MWNDFRIIKYFTINYLCCYLIIISGYDFVLIKLRKEIGTQHGEGKIIPVCLPGKNFPEFINEQVHMAGFGRREIPHCMTNMQGPEKFQVDKFWYLFCYTVNHNHR